VNAALQERLEAAAAALRTYLPDFEFSMPSGGASLWLRGPAWLDASELAQTARAQGVLIEAGDVFFMKPPYPCPWFRLRFSSLPAAQVEPGIRALALAVQHLARSRGEARVALPPAH
jgi:GntR family transcriptional regulator/MocR family aminotransferase